jgi:hypothetical protein
MADFQDARQGRLFPNDVPGGYAMNMQNDITTALVNHTKDILRARRAIFAAATIKITTMIIVLVFSGLVVLFHAMYA